MDSSIIAVCKLKGLREYLRHNEDKSLFFVNGSSLLKVMLRGPAFTCIFPSYHWEGLRTKLSKDTCGKRPQLSKTAGGEMNWKLSKTSSSSQVQLQKVYLYSQWELWAQGAVVANIKRPAYGQIRLTTKRKWEEGAVTSLTLHGQSVTKHVIAPGVLLGWSQFITPALGPCCLSTA